MKKIGIIFLFLMWGMCSAHRVSAAACGTITNPIILGDPIREMVGSIMTLFFKGDDPILGATLNVIQEEIQKELEGDGGVSFVEDVGTGSAGPGLTTPTYDYVNSKILTANLKTPYAPLNSKLSSGGDLKKVVEDMFFIASPAEATEEKQAEVLKRRTDYLTTIGKSYTRLAYEVHQNLISDMSSISANINGNGSIGATAGMDQTWHAINRALIADIAMQIQLMELDAAKFLSVQPLILMTETPPVVATATEKSSSSDGEGGPSSETETPTGKTAKGEKEDS